MCLGGRVRKPQQRDKGAARLSVPKRTVLVGAFMPLSMIHCHIMDFTLCSDSRGGQRGYRLGF